MTSPINCPICDSQCGTYHYAHMFGDPDSCYDSYATGPGEDFVDDDGNWYCSQECLDKASK